MCLGSTQPFDFPRISLRLVADKNQLGRTIMEGKAQVEITYCVT